MLEKVFELKARGTNVRREAVAGAVTFLTMSYIILARSPRQTWEPAAHAASRKYPLRGLL